MRKVFFSEDDRQTDRQHFTHGVCALMMTLSPRCIERKKELKRHLLLSLLKKKNTHVLFRVLNPVFFFSLSFSLSSLFSSLFFLERDFWCKMY